MATTWNPGDLVAVVLSGGNLIATPSGAGGVRSIASVTITGKFYFEVLFTSAGSTCAVGIANSAATLSTVASTGSGAAICSNSGGIAVNGGAQTGVGAFSANGTCCIALDIAAKLVWFRNGAAGNWNGSGAANPATGVGGYSVSALTGGSTVLYALSSQTISASSVTTANFGATAYLGTPPAGFINFGDVPASTQARAMVLA